MKITAKKIERTDPDVDNTSYELKVPSHETDDYGNKYIVYIKENVVLQNLLDNKVQLENQLKELQDRLDAINAV